MSRLHDGHLGALAEQATMQVDRRKSQCGGEDRSSDEDEIDPDLKGGQLTEPCLKRNGEQEASEDLGAGLGYAQLLQNLVPVPVHPFVQSLVTTVRRVDVIADVRSRLICHIDSSPCTRCSHRVKTHAAWQLNIALGQRHGSGVADD